jgi:hypothetical protein
MQIESLCEAFKVKDTDEVIEAYTKLMQSNESLRQKVVTMQLTALNAELVPIKADKRSLEVEARTLKFSTIIRASLFNAIKSVRYEILDEDVIAMLRMKKSNLEVVVSPRQKTKARQAESLVIKTVQLVQGLLIKANVFSEYDPDDFLGLFKLLEWKLVAILEEGSRKQLSILPSINTAEGKLNPGKINRAKPIRESSKRKLSREFTKAKVSRDLTKSKMSRETSLLSLKSQEGLGSTDTLASDFEDQRAQLKRQIKGELPALGGTTKHAKSSKNYMSGLQSKQFNESLPKFIKEMSRISGQTHKFMREAKDQPTSNDLYQDLWRRRSSLKKLNSRTTSLVSPLTSPKHSAIKVIVSTPAARSSKTLVGRPSESCNTSPNRSRKFNLTKVSKDSEPMPDFISRMNHLLD